MGIQSRFEHFLGSKNQPQKKASLRRISFLLTSLGCVVFVFVVVVVVDDDDDDDWFFNLETFLLEFFAECVDF